MSIQICVWVCEVCGVSKVCGNTCASVYWRECRRPFLDTLQHSRCLRGTKADVRWCLCRVESPQCQRCLKVLLCWSRERMVGVSHATTAHKTPPTAGNNTSTTTTAAPNSHHWKAGNRPPNPSKPPTPCPMYGSILSVWTEAEKKDTHENVDQAKKSTTTTTKGH